MTKNPDPHLTDEVLNEFLDQALNQPAQAAAEAHLAACEQCAARLAELRAVFVNLAAMPDRLLERDLAPAVMAAIRQQPQWVLARAKPQRLWASTGRRPRVLATLGALQMLAALVLLAFAWPFLASFETSLPALAITPLSAELTSLVQRMTTLAIDLQAITGIAQRWLPALAAPLLASKIPPLEPGALGLGLAAAGAAWFLGNALLLRRR